jgi:hypothetical protein
LLAPDERGGQRQPVRLGDAWSWRRLVAVRNQIPDDLLHDAALIVARLPDKIARRPDAAYQDGDDAR